ncbi:NUDIX domain-containing protein [Bdellovibrio sp. HCB337]|uniref:NUDIX domain-containing protein n=1 Tax=Bdellovibrio sp. HCB337 TaxID=3394358 RepID=UPI0039A5BC8A
MQKVHRISAKAVVINDGKILLIKKTDSGGDYYILPGGGQEHGENLHQTLIREVKEETGYSIQPKDLLFVRDYIGANHEFKAEASHFHQVELYFEAELEKDGHTKAHMPDSGQIGVEWVSAKDIKKSRVYPLSLRDAISSRKSSKVYLGDVN